MVMKRCVFVAGRIALTVFLLVERGVAAPDSEGGENVEAGISDEALMTLGGSGFGLMADTRDMARIAGV